MFYNYLKIAFRNLSKHKGFTFINIIGLSLGLTCFILIAAYTIDELSYDKFHEHSDRIYRIVNVDTTDQQQGIARVGAPWAPMLKSQYPEIEDYSRLLRFGRSLFQYEDKQFYESKGFLVDSGFMNVFTYEWIEGNVEYALTQPYQMVMTQSFAQKYFGDESPIGKQILIDQSQPYTVTGLMADPPQNGHFTFDFLASFDSHDNWFKTEININNYWTYLLLKPGTDINSLDQKIQQFYKAYVDTDGTSGSKPILQSLTSIHLTSNLQRELSANGDISRIYTLGTIAILILIIACINFMNLATARSSRRAREVGIRKVIGAKKKQLVIQFLGESIILCLIAFVFALALADLILPLFNEVAGKSITLNYWSQPLLSLGLLGIAILTGLISGSYPALFLASFQPIKVLKSNMGKIASGTLMRKGLVITQFTVSMILIVCAIIIYQQLQYVSHKDLGYQKDQLLVLSMSDNKVRTQIQPMIEEWKQQSGILGIAGTSGLMGGGDWGMPLKYEGGAESDQISPRVFAVDHDYLKVHQMDLVNGRDFSKEISTDIGAFILNETAAELTPWEDPVGKFLERPVGRNEEGEWTYQKGTIVGIVKDFHYHSLRDQIQPLAIFVEPDYVSSLIIRLKADQIPETLDFINEQWSTNVPTHPIQYFFMDDLFNQMYMAENRLGKVVGIFASLAIIIACLGLFGLAAFTAERRSKEIGIRKVLGASVRNIIVLLSKDFAKLIAIALVISIPISIYFLKQWLENFAYRIEFNPIVFVYAGLGTTLLALLTISYQSIKAAQTNPINSLKDE